MYLNDAYAPGARLDTDDGQGYDGKEGYTVNLAQDNGAHTFVFDMTQFSTEGRDVGTTPVDASDNLQFVFQMEAEGYYPLLVRVNSNINEEDAIATGERIITLEKAPVDSETNEIVKEPFAAVQTLYYGENKYGYSDDVKGRKGKLGPGDTYSDPELEILTLWWGQEKSESGMSLRFEDQFGITPKNQSCQILNYPFTTMPVTIHSWQLNKDTMSDWLDTLEGAGLNMVYTDSQGQQVKRENPGFRIINMLGAGDAADEDNMLRLMRETALKSTSNGEGRIDVANALVSTGIALATTYNIGTDMDMLTMKIVPTAAPTEFDSYDTIQYKVYDFKEKNWSGPYTLYNGTSGAVKGMEAQMTESGAMAVAYTIEKGSTSSTTRAVTLEDGTTEITSNLQTVFALIQPDETEGYKVAKNVQVTDDKDVNENPQLTAVRFDGEEKESFILGWHSVHSADGEENNDIRLMAFTEDGTLRGDLVDSISAISSQTGSSITSNFRFAKGADTLSELSILWSQPTMEVDEESTTPENNLGTADSDVLMGVRFRVDNGTIGLTAPIQLAALEEQETTSKTIEAFDGWVQSDGSLKAVALSTEYGVSDKEGNTYHIELVPGVDNEGNSTGELTEVAIQNSQTNLVSVTGSYTDAIAAEVPVPDYQALAVGASVPVQTTVTNLGTQPITSIDFQVGSESQQTPVVIQPGESATVTTNYTVVETAAGNGVLANPDYTVTATFGSGTTARAAASTGTINLNVPNLGVSTFETVQQEDGKRVLRFSLYNNSAAQLENSGRTVKVGLFSDPECTMPIESQYANFSAVSTGTRANGAEFTINSTTDLAAIDQGAYAGQITMDLAAYAKSDPENYMENGEIRSGGIAVYLKAWVEDSDNQVAELFTNNNVKSCNLQSLLELSDGEQVTVSSQVTYGADSTTVVPTLQNNSIQQKTSGYLIVDLLDESGNVIASQQTYTLENGTPTGLIQLDGENVATVQPITFNQKGAGVAYRFGESQTEASTGLTEIALSQIPLRMEDGVEAEGTTTFQVTAGASLTETTLTVLQEYLPATVTVNGKPYDVNDIASRTFSLPVGTTTLDIVVTSGDKTHTYRVEITRPSTGGGTGGGGSTRYPITVPEEDHGTVSVSPSRASSGQTVTITVTPDEGYKVGSVTVKRPNGSTVPVTGQGNGKYIFTMPSGGVTVDVTFIPEDWPFVDVTEDKWYYDAVAYVYQQGIMVGMSETTFEPNTTVNRTQVVQMLYNLEGQPQVSGDSGFSDIRDGQWYAKAVAWASANDVVAGYEDGTFRPTRAVTREEFAQILYNYAKFKGYDLSASADLGKFPDSGQVSSWAGTALGWANGNGLINGHDDGRLDPKGSTIRAQAASILMNFDKGFAQEG